ncbi:MAG: hypothetical protein J0M04_16550 [Verrucomicrobia bacterium]|nr:hypothetical protein [Verrucomicrobiota bacterium]
MRLPNKKKPGDPVMAEDWNLLLDAVAARTPRPGDGLKFISSSGGFAYSSPRPVDSIQGHPPFSVIAIAKSGGGYLVTMKEGWVIERQPKTGSKPAVKFRMPKASGTALDSTPRPQIPMGFGSIAWCRVRTLADGSITGDPEIVVSAGDENGVHYYPEDPGASGQPGDCFIRLFKLESDGGVPRVRVYQQSDIEHWAQLWTGKNLGSGARVFKEHFEDENTYRFRTVKGILPIKAEENGDEIEISVGGGGNLNLTILYASFDADGRKVMESPEVESVLYWRGGMFVGTTDPDDGDPPDGLVEKSVSLARDVT